MKRTILPAAKDDILCQFRYYLVDQDKPELAQRFLSAARGATAISESLRWQTFWNW